MPTAVLIDGAFFIKRFRAIEPHNGHDARRAAECAHRWACAHLTPKAARRNGAGQDELREPLAVSWYSSQDRTSL